MPNLKLDDIVNVVVSTIAPTIRSSFSIGLIVGESQHISKETRCKAYTSVEAMEEDGFTSDEPEYKAAFLYFAQRPAPDKLVIGFRDKEGGESWVDAVRACRNASGEWYGLYLATNDTIAPSEHQEVATYIETQCAAYFFDFNGQAAFDDSSAQVALMSLDVGVEKPEGDALGKTVSELQENIQIVGNKITGKLKKVTGFSGFSTSPDEQEGHYLVTSVYAPEGATVKFKIEGGKAAEKTLDPTDHQIIWKISSTSQKPTLTITYKNQTGTIAYDLSGLTLDSSISGKGKQVAKKPEGAEVETVMHGVATAGKPDIMPVSAATDVFSVLQELNFKRSIGLYSTTQFAGAALMGRGLGLNTGNSAAAFTLAYKSLAGVMHDSLTADEVGKLSSKNANYYVQRGGTYDVLEPGVMMDGSWFDEVIGVDQLVNDIQVACFEVLKNTPTKIPYTDAGALQFVIACNRVCADAVNRGFIGPGIWTGPDVLNLASGDALDAGYVCQVEPVANQSATRREQRICPPIYICLILQGAIHFVTIQVNVLQ